MGKTLGTITVEEALNILAIALFYGVDVLDDNECHKLRLIADNYYTLKLGDELNAK